MSDEVDSEWARQGDNPTYAEQAAERAAVRDDMAQEIYKAVMSENDAE